MPDTSQQIGDALARLADAIENGSEDRILLCELRAAHALGVDLDTFRAEMRVTARKDALYRNVRKRTN